MDVYHIKNKNRFMMLFVFSIFMMLFSLTFDTPKEIAIGFYKILVSPSHLITDYMSVGGIGATFFNASLLMLLALLSLHKRKQLLTGPIIAAMFTLFGFSLFGKNIFNSFPITLGVYLYSKLEGVDLNSLTMNSLFGTALGPAVSYICFGMNLPFIQGLMISYTVGILIGMALPALSRSFLRFHEGYSLYNLGFTCGIIGLFIQGILHSFRLQVSNVHRLGDVNNLKIAIFMYVFFFICFSIGLFFNGKSLKMFKLLLKNSGRVPADFSHIYGHGVCLINMAILGALYTSYVLIMKIPLNGPILGGIFTIFGFGMFGKHIKNVIPILFGTIVAFYLNIYDPHTVSSTITVLFATNLAPIAGEYGFLAGAIAGFAHVSIVSSVGALHGGLNLYNNGFSGGFVAATLVPIFDAIRHSIFISTIKEKLKAIKHRA